MCGIAGIVALNDFGRGTLPKLAAALPTLFRRGPDAHGIYNDVYLALGHARLSIIDTSTAGSQPMSDVSGRFTIVFNGEFFNYIEHRDELIRRGIQLQSDSDTEVLLQWYILEGPKCLQRINGFFAFAIYDNVEKSLFLARDRMGVKPLLIFRDEDRFMFASEMKTLLACGIPKVIDQHSLVAYFQLNYVPGPYSIFKQVQKLKAGHHLLIRDIGGNVSITEECYYSPADGKKTSSKNYQSACYNFYQLMEDAVARRMVSDVPLGAFLSGGIDSSVIVGLAAKHTSKLKTFSIGFKDEPMFDETRFAEAVARKHGTDHTVFRLCNEDLFSILFDTLDYIDEPFADSSALNVFLLSQQTRKHVTVALSGDGADELFSGYHKHAAEYRIRHRGWREQLVLTTAPLWSALPKSRNSKAGNTIRQLDRFAKGATMSPTDRYWRWASIEEELVVRSMFADPKDADPEYKSRKQEFTRFITGDSDINDVLRNDTELVLQGDMLTKVDLMSMANSLEVRSPFLDYTVVDFAFSIPAEFKIDSRTRKKIIRDTFNELLPKEILQRGKQGFEVPLLKWFRNELRGLIEVDLLSVDFIAEQGIFNPIVIENLKRQLFSHNPGEAVARIWALIVFQYWWKKHMRHAD